MQIQSLALLSGLRIQHCRELWYNLQTMYLVLQQLQHRLQVWPVSDPLPWGGQKGGKKVTLEVELTRYHP